MMTMVERDMKAGNKKRKRPAGAFLPRCLKCGAPLPKTSKRCPTCGYVIGSALLKKQAF